MTDKERDDALIAEKIRLTSVLEAITRLGTVGPWHDDLLRAAAILRGDEQPKPDRAEVLFDDLYGKTKDEQIDCFRRHFDELRAEIEAERPAVVVPEDVLAWARSIDASGAGFIIATPVETAARFILSLDGAKGGE